MGREERGNLRRLRIRVSEKAGGEEMTAVRQFRVKVWRSGIYLQGLKLDVEGKTLQTALGRIAKYLDVRKGDLIEIRGRA